MIKKNLEVSGITDAFKGKTEAAANEIAGRIINLFEKRIFMD